MNVENQDDVISTIDSYEINSEEVNEIITEVPSFILRYGITVILGIIMSIIVISAFIQYPDIVKTELTVSSLNAPKSVYAKNGGKVMSLYAREGDIVKQGASLAFMECTGSHEDVLILHDSLSRLSRILNETGKAPKINLRNLNLGEIQGAYQSFHQQYLQYIATQNGGYYLSRRRYLESDLAEIKKLKEQILSQQAIQEQEYANVEQEFEAYKVLYKKGVISNSEFKLQENKFLSGKYPLQQSATSVLNNNAVHSAKMKEILELDHLIEEEKLNFVQSLNHMITQTDLWLNQYVLRAPVGGKVSFAGILQEKQTINENQEVFVIDPANTDFFGEVHIPQYNMGKVKVDQRTLIKIRSYPYEQYGLIRGKVKYVSDVAFRDSIFVAKISFDNYENKDPAHRITLKNGMRADVEIITQESSLLQRFLRSFYKMLDSH